MFKEPGQLHVHFAIPFYAGDQLIRSLRPLAPVFAQSGTSIPDPAVYRPVFGDKVRGQDGGVFMPREVERLSKEMRTDRKCLILSFNDFMGAPDRIFEGGRIYRHAAERINYLRDIFPNRELTLFFSAANPGSVMCALMNAGSLGPEARNASLSLRPLWSDLMDRIDDIHPDLPSVIWATEDTPVTWPVVMRKVLGRDRPFTAPGGLAMASALLDDTKKELFQRRLKARPLGDEKALMLFVNDFLNKHGQEALRYFDVDIPGWTQKVIDDFELLYDQDIDSCADLEQVRVITLETELSDR